ncbi:CpaD family pilus assembly protein [Sphingobium algorifonticola]|uniref:Pilus assembly protein CpaD n=1 Tax=Sphingobium algorifonticola TaxID=2008318 RepID=A0A437JA50_9SPHN|nr:CpaD family pilus assembly lipoprotein [Sphingobium algorifonticola]RVT42182.1 pilus assembly protein CpaD [Sphingobium algorifonticola]
MTSIKTSGLKTSGLRLAIACAALLPLAACNNATIGAANRGLDSVHQPVVAYTSFNYDVQVGGNGDLTPAEAYRLEGWLQSIGIGYGDRISVAPDGGYYGPGVRDGIANVIGRHGLLIEEDPAIANGAAPEGAVRLVVRRASASVPGCPDWTDKAETDGNAATSRNFGCGANSNLAAMVANPEDLVRGQTGQSALRTATSNRAIQTYREKQPTGAGDLKTMTATTGGN